MPIAPEDRQASAFETKASIFGPPGKVQGHKGRAVFVPDGFTAAQIWDAAKMLEREFDVVPYTSQHMAVAILVTARNGLPEKVEPKFAGDMAKKN